MGALLELQLGREDIVFIPVSRKLIKEHMDWSEPVQLRFEPSPDERLWHLVMRAAPKVRVVHLAEKTVKHERKPRGGYRGSRPTAPVTVPASAGANVTPKENV